MRVITGSPEPSPIDDAWELTRGAAALPSLEAMVPAKAPSGGPAEAARSLEAGLSPDAAADGTAGAPRLPDAPLPSDATLRDVRLWTLDDGAGLDTVDARGLKVGVIFVHGIGSQPAAETLFTWAAPIIRTVWAWAERQAEIDGVDFRDPVEWAQVDLTGRSTPLIELAIPAVAPRAGRPQIPPQTWIMTEAWWAADIRPAGIGEMLEWSRRHVGTIIDGIVAGIRIAIERRPPDPNAPDLPGRPRPRGGDRLEKLALGSLFTAAVALATPIYLILRVVQKLPIPGAKDISTAPLDWFLAEWFGDVRVLLHDRAQAANLRMRLATTIEKVRNYGAERIILVAHSGGTVLSYMMLADPAHDDLQVDKLITHGQAIGLAWKVGGRDSLVSPSYDEGLRTGDRLLRPVHRVKADRRWPRWVDFHATHDVAPAFSAGGWPGDADEGVPTAARNDECDGPDQSWTIANRMSVVNDHGGYWDNEESFVIPVLRELDTPDGTWESSRFYPDRAPGYQSRVLDREVRVGALKGWWNAWMVLLGTGIVVGGLASLFSGFGLNALGFAAAPWIAWAPIVGAVADLPKWILGLVVFVVLAYVLGSALAVGAWNRLDERERARARSFGRFPVLRHAVRGKLVLYLLTSVALAGIAIAPGIGLVLWPIDLPQHQHVSIGSLVLDFNLPMAVDFDVALNAFVVAVLLVIAAGSERLASAVGTAVAWTGWLPETRPLEEDAERLGRLATPGEVDRLDVSRPWSAGAEPDAAEPGTPAPPPPLEPELPVAAPAPAD